MIAYSVMEGDNVTVCAAVLCGSLRQETTVTLSTVNGTAKGHYMKIILRMMLLHNCYNIFHYIQLALILLSLNK